MNFAPHAELASAELARMRGDADGADAAYDRAVTASRASHAPKREALALELAAAHLRPRDPARAARLAEDAARAYRRWGAAAKADRMARLFRSPR
jgi:hypothetical protein